MDNKKKELFDLAHEILSTGTSEEIYHTWRWIRIGHDHPLVSLNFKKAWLKCNVYDWVDLDDELGAEFQRLSLVHKRVRDALRDNLVNQLIGVLEAACDDGAMSGVLVDAIHRMKNIE